MIIPNGYIELRTTEESGGFDASGFPIDVLDVWSPRISCQYLPLSQDYQARNGGEAIVRSSYAVLTEGRPPQTDNPLRLYTDDGTMVGEFSIISIEELRAVGQTRIVI